MSKPFLSASETEALLASMKKSHVPSPAPASAEAPERTAVLPAETAMPLRPAQYTSPSRATSRVSLIASALSRFCAGLVLGSTLVSTASADSLWRDETARPLVADRRAASVGDIVTIVVQESTTTAKDQNTKTSKQSGVDASISSFLYSPAASGLLTKKGQMPAMQFSSKNDFNGGGAINNSEKIVARIAARVVDVLPNRNLVLEGTRETAFSGEQQTAILRGTVRAEDIAANNTVFSYNIVDATIKFMSKGSISDTQKKGWFTRVWDKVTPF